MNLVRTLGLGAIGLFVLGGWKLFKHLKGTQKQPTKQQLLCILQMARQQFYPILMKVADVVTKELAPRGFTPEQNQKIVLQDPTIRAEIEKINEKIYSEYSEDEVREAIEKKYSKDGDIFKQRNQFQEQYKKSMLGVAPQRKMIISRKITKPKLLEAIAQILNDKIARLEIQKNQNTTEQELNAFLQRDVEEDERITKQKIKQKLGLCAKDAIKIFQFAVVRYRKEDKIFSESYDQILNEYNDKMKTILMG